MGIIYKATNTINNKKYIGKTIYSLNKRLHEHKRDALRGSNCKFHRAIRKYGFESFNFEVIENVPDEILNERECYWIQVLDTYKNGYNSTFGGDGSTSINRKQIYDLWEDGKSINDIATLLNCSHCTVQLILKNYSFLLRSFSSMAEAAKYCNVDRSLISVCCQKKRLSGAGYQWRYSDDNSPLNYNLEQKCALPVMQYSMTGNFIANFRSISEAERITGVNRGSISDCCKGKRKDAGGFCWKYDGGVILNGH